MRREDRVQAIRRLMEGDLSEIPCLVNSDVHEWLLGNCLEEQLGVWQ